MGTSVQCMRRGKGGDEVIQYTDSDKGNGHGPLRRPAVVAASVPLPICCTALSDCSGDRKGVGVQGVAGAGNGHCMRAGVTKVHTVRRCWIAGHCWAHLDPLVGRFLYKVNTLA